MIDQTTARARARELEDLAQTAQDALPSTTWRAGAHGAHAAPKPGTDGVGHRFSLSRTSRCAPGHENLEHEAAAVTGALAGEGCALEQRAFGGGDAIWVVATRGAASLTVKLSSNGNRLVTGESGDFDDASADEAAAALR